MNPGSGTTERHGAHSARERIEAAFLAFGITPVFIIGSAGEIVRRLEQALAREADDAEFDALVAAGGDGTVSVAANVLAGGALPLGVVPLGTFNHFARDLGLPLDIPHAVRTIAEGLMRRVDVGEVNGRVFVNTSSLGIYPLLALERYRGRRRGWSKWAAVPLAVLRALWRLPRPRLHVEATARAAALASPCLFVGNNFYDLSAFPIAERARLDGGELCLYVVTRKSRLALLWLACRVVLGRLEPGRDLIAASTTELTVRSRRHRMRVALDGDSHVMRTPLRYRIRPMALSVFVPRSGSAPE